MKKWEWERLREAYRAQRDKAAAEHRRADYEYFDCMFKWASDELAAENSRRYEEIRKIAMIAGA